MRRVFSKPGADVRKETQGLIRDNDQSLARQLKVCQTLKGCPERTSCPVCGQDPAGSAGLTHRGVEYLLCQTCGHIVSRSLPPEGYPRMGGDGITFDRVYPALSPEEYGSRRERIYAPKLEFVLDSLAEAGQSRDQALASRWCELGSGHGFFLDALKAAGAERFLGLEADPKLVQRSARVLGPGRVEPHQGLLSRAVRETEADIYAAWFVIEHIEDTRELFRALAAKPPGTVLAFAVPCFSLSSALETVNQGFRARQWDNGVHTQIFTDRSIAHCLETARMETVGEWYFGQDAADLWRMLKVGLRDSYPPELTDSLEQNLVPALDAIQAALDRARLSDSRHIVAVRR